MMVGDPFRYVTRSPNKKLPGGYLQYRVQLSSKLTFYTVDVIIE